MWMWFFKMHEQHFKTLNVKGYLTHSHTHIHAHTLTHIHKMHAKHFLKLAGMLSKINSGSKAWRKEPAEPHETAHLKGGNRGRMSRGRAEAQQGRVVVVVVGVVGWADATRGANDFRLDSRRCQGSAVIRTLQIGPATGIPYSLWEMTGGDIQGKNSPGQRASQEWRTRG